MPSTKLAFILLHPRCVKEAVISVVVRVRPGTMDGSIFHVAIGGWLGRLGGGNVLLSVMRWMAICTKPIWGLRHQTLVSRDWISNYIPSYIIRCNYLCMPQLSRFWHRLNQLGYMVQVKIYKKTGMGGILIGYDDVVYIQRYKGGYWSIGRQSV